KLYKHEACSVCSGSGAEPGSKVETCKTCEGRGQVRQSVRTVFGMMQQAGTCPECDGVGSKPSRLCAHCRGTGVLRKTKEIAVAIPAGIRDGETLKIAHEGEHPGRGGRAGDLFVHIHVTSHPLFEREGNDVSSTARIPFSMLALGGTVEIETVDGRGSLTIPEATEPGTVFKIRGKGFPFLQSHGRGDHLVTVQPMVPRRPTKDQRRSLENLRETGL
ncbi:MAG: DnaJ C-terminal domain-containing protein, partial [Patescibacteria group bacterium]